LNSLTKYCTPLVPDINHLFSALNKIRYEFYCKQNSVPNT